MDSRELQTSIGASLPDNLNLEKDEFPGKITILFLSFSEQRGLDEMSREYSLIHVSLVLGM